MQSVETGVEILQFLNHFKEDSRSAGVSKVSQIATMFQPQQDFEEKQECLGPSTVSVVRTESHVARFNTARALFEKMSEQKGGGERRTLKDASNKRIGSGSCGVGGVGRGTPSPSSSGGNPLSRSPSPCSPRSLIHSNGFSSHPTKPVSISGSSIPTISSLSSTSPPTPSTFHTTLNNPSITSVLSHQIGTNILSPRTFSEANDPSKGGRWAPVIKSEISKPEILKDRNILEKHTTDKYGYNKTSSQSSKSSVSYPNEGSKLTNEDNVRCNTDNSRISSRENPCKNIKLDFNSKIEINSKFHSTNNFNNVDQCESNKISRDYYNNKSDSIPSSKNSSFRSDYDSKPSKPTKPDLLSEKRLNTSSHLQNQKIIQRHKNWFHTFSKSKSPASSPNKNDLSNHDNGSSVVGSRLQSSCNRPSYECEDKSNHINSSRKHIKEVNYQKRKSLDDLDSISSEEIQATHNDWRRERAAILAGRANSRLDPGEEADKAKSTEEKVRNYDNVSTLPSSWCPPKQYNAAVKGSRSPSTPSVISDSHHDSSLRHSPMSGGDNTSESEPRFSESGSNSGSFRDGYAVKREISEVHRSSFDSQRDQRGNNQNGGRGHRESSPSPSASSSLSRRSDYSKVKPESRASSDLVNERLQRQSNERNRPSQETEESKNDLEADVKLRKFKAMSTEDVSSRRSFDVKLDTNDGSLKRNSYEIDRERRLKEWERKRTERGNRLSDEIKVHNIRVSDISAFTKNADKEKKENDEVIWVKRETNTGSLDSRRIKEERKRREEDKIKEERQRRDEELERKRREALERTHREEKEREEIKRRKIEELERKKLEESKKQKAEEEEKIRQRELEKERRKELELERKRKQEEIAKELELRKLEEQKEKNRLKEKEERERIRREQEDREKKEAKERARRLREEERERFLKERQEAEENIRKQREKEERERQLKEQEERERKEAEEKAKIQKEKEKKIDRQQKEEEEERERIRFEEEERERLEAEERERKEMEEEKIRKQKEEVERERLMEEERRSKMTSQERMEEEERLKKEKDRLEIEKTKRRIAELKREREELQRQQLMRMQQILVDEQGNEREKVIIEKEEVIRINLDEISNEERKSESIAALDALVHGYQNKHHQVLEHSEQKSDSGINIVQTSFACPDSKSVNTEIPKNISLLNRQDSAEVVSVQEYLDENKSSNIEYALVGLDASELTDDVEVTDIETTDVDVTEVDHSTSSNSSTSHITDKSISEKPELMLAKSEERRMFKTESSLDDVLQTPVDEVYYDPTVTSAQYKIEFCTSPLGITINQDESKTGSPYRSQIIDSSTLSSEFEPLPPPIPPHNVYPPTIMSDGLETPSVCQNEAGKSNDHVVEPLDDRLEQMADLMEYVDADPEVMTPEEESKLLSHKADTSLLSDDQAKEVSHILSQTKDVQDGSCLSSQSEVSNELLDSIVQPSGEETLRESSPPVDYDDDEAEEESSGVPVGQVTSEGFVVRTKEVHYEDGIHYFEDGNFWIEVPGLQENDDEDDEDEFPEHIPFHKHTKLKFSTAPIQLFSTFSVTDYDRKNEDVDPVAASAEYELEKRVEKMEVFPVQIEKGEGGLGLSIIGMGVGADAGVEKLGIFVKTISPDGATDKDGRIKVNDQIIEVDNQSLVGVTQMYAASVLKNTNGSVNFLIGREQDPDNSEVAMLIRQSLMADMEREERRRALGGPNYDSNTGGAFESFSSPSGGDSPSEETSRNNISQYDEVGDVNPYGEEGCEDDYADSYGSCPSSPQPRTASSPPDAPKSSAENSTSEMIVLGQHLMEVQHKNRLHEEEIVKLRSKITELERELGDKVEISKSLEDMTSRLIDIEDKLQSRQAEIATYQDMLEQSQGQYIVLEKKYYKAKKIIKEYQSRERDFLHREEYHITQLEEKDALYNSLVKALKDRVIQLEGDLIKAQQKAGLPVVLPPDLNAQSSNFVHSSHKGFNSTDEQVNVDQKEPPRKPATLGTLDPDLSDTEGCDTQTSESSKASTVERKIPLKEELDVAVPPHELLDVSFSKAKGELATRGGLAKRQLPSLKKTASSSSTGSFDRSLDDSVDEGLPESHQQHLFSSTENSAASSAATISTSNVSSNSYTRHEEVFQQSISSSSQSSSSHSYSVSSSQHQTSQTNAFPQNNGFSRPPPPYHPPQGHNPPSYISPPQNQYSQQCQLPHGGQSHPSSYGNNHNESQHIQNVSHQSQSQPPPYQPPPSAPLSHRSLVTAETNTGRSDMPYRHPPPIARVQPVNRVEAPPEKPPTPTSPQYGPRTPQQQSLAHQLKTLLAEREANAEQSSAPQSPIKKSASMLMEDVRQAVIQADLSIGKKPMISAPIHMSSTAQVVSTGQFVQHRGSPIRNSGGDNSNSQQRISHDFGSWSPKSSRSNQNHSSSIVAPSNTSGVVLLSQRPIDSSLPPLSNDDCNLSSSVDHLPTGSQGSLAEDESTSSFDSQPSPSHLQDRNRFLGYSREAVSVLDWSKEQVGQWLVLQGMEVHVGKFVVAGITGPRLVNIDTKDLKSMGLSTDEKNKIKRKVKELRQNLEKERKQIEKERKEREKLQKKAEKLAKEAERRKK